MDFMIGDHVVVASYRWDGALDMFVPHTYRSFIRRVYEGVAGEVPAYYTTELGYTTKEENVFGVHDEVLANTRAMMLAVEVNEVRKRWWK